MSTLKTKIKEFPTCSGVYQFIDKDGEILYIGKAKNLRNRLKSYFAKEIGRGPAIDLMVASAVDIKLIPTESEIEAIILEADLIGKLKPKYNIRQKDDKSFLMLRISKGDLPKISYVRYRDYDPKDKKAYYFGPYPAGDLLKRSMRYLRKIFPFADCSEAKEQRYRKLGRTCLYGDLGICPGVCIGDDKIARHHLKQLIMFLRGKKKQVIKQLEKEMARLSKNKNYEEAAKVRDQLTALAHLNRVGIGLHDDNITAGQIAFRRIEAYDIANISGQFAAGAMAVFQAGQPQKDEYRKFKIKYSTPRHPRVAPTSRGMARGSIGKIPAFAGMTTRGVGDIQMIGEVLERRLKNIWPAPDLILIDGGISHLNVAKKILADRNLAIPIVAIAKGPKRQRNDFSFSDSSLAEYVMKSRELKIILVKARNEAHRFATSYYKKLHSRYLLHG